MHLVAVTGTPVLQTERLILRAHRAADYEDSVAMWSEPSVVKYTIGKLLPPQRSWTRLLGYRGHWELMGYGYWTVEEKARASLSASSDLQTSKGITSRRSRVYQKSAGPCARMRKEKDTQLKP